MREMTEQEKEIAARLDERVAHKKRLHLETSNPEYTNPEEASKFKLSPTLFRRISLMARKAKSFGVTGAQVLEAARHLNRNGLPTKESGVSKVLRRLTRKDRIALNAVAGTRPIVKDRKGFIAPLYPVYGESR